MIKTICNTINKYRTNQVYTRSSYRLQLADLPPNLFTYWQRTAALEFKGIPRDAFFSPARPKG